VRPGSNRESPAIVNKIVYNLTVKSSEFKRWLAAQGATFTPGKGSHLMVELNGKISILPMHSKDLKKGTVEGVKKQLGLK
jgi:mRNA interferase HicA